MLLLENATLSTPEGGEQVEFADEFDFLRAAGVLLLLVDDFSVDFASALGLEVAFATAFGAPL